MKLTAEERANHLMQMPVKPRLAQAYGDYLHAKYINEVLAETLVMMLTSGMADYAEIVEGLQRSRPNLRCSLTDKQWFDTQLWPGWYKVEVNGEKTCGRVEEHPLGIEEYGLEIWFGEWNYPIPNPEIKILGRIYF